MGSAGLRLWHGGVAVAVGAALVGAAVIVDRSESSSSPPAAAPAAVVDPAPTAPALPSTVHTVDLAPAAGSSTTSVKLPRRSTSQFSLLGVTWTDPRLDFRGAASVRTRAVGGAWSAWQALDLDDSRATDREDELVAGRARGGSDPLWVGTSDGVEVKVVSATGKTSSTLPAGLRLDLVNPGRTSGGRGGGSEIDPSAPSPAEAPSPSEASSSAPAPSTAPVSSAPVTSAPAAKPAAPTAAGVHIASGGPTSPAVMPPYVSRGDWRADESIVHGAPGYGESAKVVFVHHTATNVTYDCADSPAIVRGIHAWDIQSRGWSDIGYNFLLDKCGTLFEGRKGGVDRPVIGAHTLGFNTNSVGVVLIGTYTNASVVPTQAAQDTIAQLAAYKLGQYGNDPAGDVTLVSGESLKFRTGQSVVMKRISGHRDAAPTECPGDGLYNQLGSIRRAAAGAVQGLKVTGLAGSRQVGTNYLVRSTVTVNWTTVTPTERLSRFELLIDGRQVATAEAAARSASITVPAGRHAVQVRAVNVDGQPATAVAWSVVGDQTAPRFVRPPELTLRTGGLWAGAVPTTLSWSATDAVALASITVTGQQQGAFGPSKQNWANTAKPNVAGTWTVRAVDAVGNAVTASVRRTPVLVAETSAKRGGRWTTAKGAGHLGKAALASSSKNASLTWTVNGRSAAFIAARARSAGKVYVYVDGKKVATVDLRAAKTAYRQSVWTKSWAKAGKHTIKIVVAGTKGRPKVTADGVLYLK
jgi:hypothetical protein